MNLVEPTNQLFQSTNSILSPQVDISNNSSSKNKKISKIVLLLITTVPLLLTTAVIYAFKNDLLVSGFIGKNIPKSYVECLKLTSNKTDYEHNSYRCVWRVDSENMFQYNLCKAAKGNMMPGLIGCTTDKGCDKTPDMCEIVYYKDDFKIPQTFEECQPYSIMPTEKSFQSDVQSCVISIDLWGYNQDYAKSLFNKCNQLGRQSFTDDIQSDNSMGNCTLFYWKGRQPFPEIYTSATYSATSSAFIKKALLTIHNKQLSKYKHDVLLPTPIPAIILSQTIKNCQESGGEWNNISCDCNKTINKDTGCPIDKKYFPFIDDNNLSSQPEPPVVGSNGLEELVFKDDLSSCSYLGNKNNVCAVCQQDSDCGNEYKDDWFYWIRYVYGPTCDNGYCKYRRVIFRTELDYDGKLLYGLK